MTDPETISADVVDAALHIHRGLGPGLLESVYETVLAGALSRRGYRVERQRTIDIEFDGMRFEGAFRADLLVDEMLLIEIKSVERLTSAHAKQVLSYLRLMDLPLGLLINFGGETLREGLKRIVNNHRSFASSRLRVNQTSPSPSPGA
jgi:iron complex transport system substrate-binding protein